MRTIARATTLGRAAAGVAWAQLYRRVRPGAARPLDLWVDGSRPGASGPPRRGARVVQLHGAAESWTEATTAALAATFEHLPSLARVRVALPPSGEAATSLVRALGARTAQVAVTLVLDDAFAGFDPEGDVLPVRAALEAALQALKPHVRRCDVVFRLTPANAVFADDVLEMAQAVGAPATFHPSAPLLDRPLDAPGGDPIPNVRFHACMFFDRLPRERTLSLAQRLYYRHVAHRIEQGPAGPDLEGHLTTAGDIGPRLTDLVGIGRQTLLRRPPATAVVTPGAVTAAPTRHSDPRTWRHVLITGWYGTETHGDKAILGEVLHFVRQHAPACRITISTIYRKISTQSSAEMDDLRGIVWRDIGTCAAPDFVEGVDAVIFGGGPIMESAEMRRVWPIFAEANRQQKARVIFGCGVGPIHTDEVRALITATLAVATAGFVRDPESQAYATKLVPGNVLDVACDPAVAFVHRWRMQRDAPVRAAQHTPRLAALLRSNTSEFHTDAASLARANEAAARTVGAALRPICEDRGVRADLLHMNAHWVGGDDRLFNRQVAQGFADASHVRLVREYLPLYAHMEAMADSDVALAMRYHGHVFSLALGIPFVSIDYTGATGKVGSLVRRIGYSDWSMTWDQIDAEHAPRMIARLLDERAHWSAFLAERTEGLVADLNRTYGRVFGVSAALAS